MKETSNFGHWPQLTYSKALKITSNLLAIFALSFLGYIIYTDWDKFSSAIRSINLTTFSIAAALAITLNIATAYLYTKILNTKGQASIHVSAFFISQLMKYIPGKIWTVGHQKAFYGNQKSTLSIVYANLILTYYQIALCVIVIISIAISHFSPILAALAVIFFVAALSLVKARPLDYLASKFSIHAFQPNKANIRLKTKFLLIYSTLFIAVYILSHTLLVISVIKTTFPEGLLIVAILSAAWVAGLFFVFTPAGLGAREGLIFLLVGFSQLDLNLESIAAIALTTRAWMLAVDVIPGLGSLIYLSSRQ